MAFHNLVLLIVIMAFFGVVVAVFIWNTYWRRRFVTGFIARYPNVELETARDGQFVEVSGVVTYGSFSSGVIWCPLLTVDSITTPMSSYTIHTHISYPPSPLSSPHSITRSTIHSPPICFLSSHAHGALCA